jgi:glycosyltransferase involved in cell wall biosynthesis
VKIAEIAPPYLTVPPAGYGGIELIVALLADGLVERGHDVTLVASAGSNTAARLVPVLERAPGTEAIAHGEYSLLHDLVAYHQTEDFDVVHDHTLPGPALAALAARQPPVVHTLHGPWTEAARAYYGRLQEAVHLVAISESQRAANPDIDYAGVVPNGIDVSSFPFREEKEDVLVFMGRCNREKGPELAVEVAKRAGLPLIMVVKRAEPAERQYWDEVVAPRLTGDEEIHDLMGHDEKSAVLGRAQAFLMPIQWPEPFGLVMVEAMACGTPVIARPLGAACEVVEDGVTGFLRSSIEEMAEAVAEASTLSATACRDRVAARYSAEAMVAGYERVFADVVAQSPAA